MDAVSVNQDLVGKAVNLNNARMSALLMENAMKVANANVKKDGKEKIVQLDIVPITAIKMEIVLRKEFVSVKKIGMALVAMRDHVQMVALKEESAKKVIAFANQDGQESHAMSSPAYQIVVEMEFA